MSLEQLKNNPMNIHKAYKDGFLHLSRAPENASGEVMLASLYRNVGFKIGEGHVTKTGKNLSSRLNGSQKTYPELGTGFDGNTWNFILEKILESPKKPGQPKKKFIQLTPLVPDTTLYSFAARYSGSPWNPGALTTSILGFGCKHSKDFEEMWSETFNALNVDESDDIWARIISQEFGAWRDNNHIWTMNEITEECKLDKNDRQKYHIPAKRFVKDLRALFGLKSALTRRQWISMLESLVRLGNASHALWICEVNKQVWSLFRDAIKGTPPPPVFELGERIMQFEKGFWRYGETASPVLKEKIRDYVMGRVGVNYMLFLIEKLVSSGKLRQQTIKFGSSENIHSACQYLYDNRAHFNTKDIFAETTLLFEKDPRLMTCSSGPPSNFFEFLLYSLSQRQTIEKDAQAYDQGYWIKKRGSYSSAPWVLAAGPVSLMAIAYCCSKESLAPRTVDDFCRHLGHYGIAVNAVELSSNGLSQSLRDLGLVIDSPDAEGGMVVLNPFKNMGRA